MFQVAVQVAILFIFSLPVRAAVTLSIDGVNDSAVEEQLEAYLSIPENATRGDVDSLQISLSESAENAMQALGYYSSKFRFTSEVDGDDAEITLIVDVGEPVRVVGISVDVVGEAAEDEAFADLPELEKLAEGEIFNHGNYEALKAKLANIAQSRGYFDGLFIRSEVTVDPAKNSADIALQFDSGERYALGEVEFVDPPVNEDILRHWIVFPPGTPYESRLVADLTNTLLDSGYFANVRVVPQRDLAEEGVIPVRVELTPNADNTINFGIGFATDTGPRGRISWDKPLINRYGHSFHSEVAASQVRQSISASYKIPSPSAPRTNYYQIEAGAQREKIDDRIDRLLTLGVQRVSITENHWQQSESLRWEDHRFTISNVSRETELYLPGISWSRTQRKGGVYPTWGNRYGLRLQGASRELASDVDLAKVIANSKWLRSVGDNNYLLVRAEVGALSTNDFNQLPLSHRFFAGGDQSIRGFGYQTVGPKDSSGTVIGGRYLTTASAEFVFGIGEKWGWAFFADAGKAFNDTGEDNRVGVGTGLRWKSPVGPLRVDVAVGVSEDDEPVRLHLAIGPEL